MGGRAMAISIMMYLTMAHSAIMIFLGVLQLTSAQYGIGHPMNITRAAGDRNVFIPCPFGGPAAVTWRIGENYYAQSTLPEPYTSVPGGLIIGIVYQNMSGLSFQCLTPSNNGLYDTESGKGMLTVKPTPSGTLQDSEDNILGYIPYHSQPINFTRNENDENVFVPCPYGGPAAQTWKIGEHFYSSSSLPKNYHPTTGGLIISLIHGNMSGLTFQCFSPNGTGLYVDESSIGTLTVNELHDIDIHDTNSSSELSALSNYSALNTRARLILDHQNFYFTNTSVTFAWKEIGSQCDLRTVYFVNSTQCVIAHEERHPNTQYYSVAVMKKKATIGKQHLIDERKKLMYYSISVGSDPTDNNVCDHIKVFNDITVKEEVFTETHLATPYNDTCINLPSASTSKGALRFVLSFWSKTDTLDQEDNDIICLAECTGEIGCSLVGKCTPALNETIFSDSVTLRKRDNMTTMFQICFSNPTIEMNQTKVHVFYERSCTDTKSRETIAVAEYVKAIVLNVIVPPPPPIATINSSSGEICVIPPQADVNFPADYYKIVITDVTGYEIFKNESVATGCITTDSLLQHECAPFNVSVVGHNIYGDSSSTFLQADAGFNLTNWCDCANKKVSLKLKNATQSVSIKYEYTCNFFSGFNEDLESSMQFVTKLESSIYDQDSEIQNCSNGKATGIFSDLDCRSTYRLTAYFALPNGNISDCVVTNVEGIEFKTTFSYRDWKCQHARFFWKIMIPSLIIPIIAAIVVVICCLCYCRKKKRCCWKDGYYDVHTH